MERINNCLHVCVCVFVRVCEHVSLRFDSFHKQHQQKKIVTAIYIHARNSFEADTLLYFYDIKIQLEKARTRKIY